MLIASPEVAENCFALIYTAVRESRNRRFDIANRALALALLNGAELPEAFLSDFRAALCYCGLLIRAGQYPSFVTPEIRSQANALLNQSEACASLSSFQSLMFEMLGDLGEHRLALPFGERALALAVENGDSAAVADWLWKVGRCYSRLGLRDHAAIAYRGSARIFRKETADPRLPVVLLALANSIRKSAPSEAEALYKEAAGWWESKGQLESATPAWMNLGIVCSDQRRFEEAINYYERVRRVRESFPGTPPARIGVLYNNIAACYRKMTRFAEAHQAAERAIRILSQPGVLGPNDASSLALALGTKGMILRDEGRDSESLEWFRRASAELEKQPSPNTDYLIEELEHEAAALTRLNRMAEARGIQERIASIRRSNAEIQPIPHDANEPIVLPEGALLIELDAGMRGGSSDGEIARLGSCLDQILKGQNLGEWQSLIRAPECSTLIYYGSNAQAMYKAVVPTLRHDSRFEGALITIRQGADQRQVMLPRRVVN